MDLSFEILRLRKRVPLAISRGTRSESVVAWIQITSDGVEGWGEAGLFSVGEIRNSEAELIRNLEQARTTLNNLPATDRSAVDLALRHQQCDSATRAGINQAMIDWLARSRNTSAASLLQIPGETPPPVSVTIGLNSPEGAAERVRLWLKTAAFRFWKLKVGSPHGIEADQALCEAVLREVPPGSKLSVDANGGWDLKLAQRMGAWLSERGFDHMEQPLPRGQESDLPLLRAHCRLPIIADESCLNATEIPALVSRVDGINIKLFKCGGVDEALQMIASARRLGLKVMLGCYGNTLLGNTASAHLSPLADYVDLDSHWNLEGDPFLGATLNNGILHPPSGPGFGVTLCP